MRISEERSQIISPFTPLGICRSHNKRTKVAFQVKVEYEGERFASFLLENVSYDADGLVSSIRKNCSSLVQLDADKIRLRYREEDGDMVNVCQADLFAFSAKEAKLS